VLQETTLQPFKLAEQENGTSKKPFCLPCTLRNSLVAHKTFRARILPHVFHRVVPTRF